MTPPQKTGEPVLPLDASFVADWTDEKLNQYLSVVFSSTAFDVAEDRSGVRLMGQDRRHHQIDEGLQKGIDALGLKETDQIGMARWQDGPLCLTLEDSWSGWFLAKLLAKMKDPQPIVVLHLDDHRDMMPSLLSKRRREELWDPVDHVRFDVASQSDWARAIASGTVNIGTWLTAFVLGVSFGTRKRPVHIRHLRPKGGSSATAPKQAMIARFQTCPVLASLPLGYLDFSDDREAQQSASFHASYDVTDLMQDLPNCLCVLHIDLDYFVNDFNGNPSDGHAQTTSQLPVCAEDGLARLDHMLGLCRQPIMQTIVATSPGFCAAQHWPALIDRINTLLQHHGITGVGLDGSEA